MRILITGAGGAAAISVWKSLGREHEIHMADIDACAAGLYLVPAEQRIIIPRGKSPEFVETMLRICQERKIEVLISTVDSELAPLAKSVAQFEVQHIKVPLSPYQALQTCYDKYTLLSQAKGIVPVPDFILLTRENISSVTTFPRFAKPRYGAGSHGIMTINNAEELANVPTDSSYLVQELLPGDEYSVDSYLDSKGRPIAAVTRLRMKVDSGVAVASCTLHEPELAAQAIKIAEHIGIRYVANIQFKRAENGEFKLLEINPRFSGTLPLTTAAGVDIPKLLIRDIEGETLPEGLMTFKELMVVRYWTEHFFPKSEWDALCQN